MMRQHKLSPESDGGSIQRLGKSRTRSMYLLGVILILIPTVVTAGTPIRIKIDTVPDLYRPTNAPLIEPVSMQEFHFEVNEKTSRARIVVEYTYPDEIIYQTDDDQGGPRPAAALIPGLRYDPASHTVVYEDSGKRTVCAYVKERSGILRNHPRVQNTGSCFVSAEVAKHAEDDGWEVRRFTAIDTYFEVR